jgi:hypothetical protein
VAPPTPAKDTAPAAEEVRQYARRSEPALEAIATGKLNDAYPKSAKLPNEAKADDTDGLDVTIDFEALFQPDRERFYEVDYRAHLRKMVEHLVETEGPIYFDVLVERVARAHGFQRSGETVQKVIDAALGRHRYPCSKDVDRDVIWPTDATIEKIAYRGTMGREHADIPLLELAGLADLLRARGLEEEEEIVRAMKDHFGLARLAMPTRQRFEVAVGCADPEA